MAGLPVLELDQGPSAPQIDRGVQRVRRRFPLLVTCRRPTFGDETVKAANVDRVARGPKDVTARHGRDRRVAQYLSEPHHEVLDHFRARARRLIAP